MSNRNGSNKTKQLECANDSASLVVDCSGSVFGRVASFVAKAALKGNKVILINAEQSVITGKRENILEEFIWRRSLKNKANPEHSPKFPRVPHLLVKRMIRGMLPWKTKRGREAYKRIFAYTGVPKEYISSKAIKIPKSELKPFRKYMTILDICKYFGYKSS